MCLRLNVLLFKTLLFSNQSITLLGISMVLPRLVPVVGWLLSFALLAVETFLRLVAFGKHADPEGQGPIVGSCDDALIDVV